MFGCAHPEGYRKALNRMRLAAKFGLPIICLIDTPGAFPGIRAEEQGQAQLIATNLLAAAALKLTAKDLARFGAIDDIIPEPLGGAHRDHREMANTLKTYLLRYLKELRHVPVPDLLENRYQKF